MNAYIFDFIAFSMYVTSMSHYESTHILCEYSLTVLTLFAFLCKQCEESNLMAELICCCHVLAQTFNLSLCYCFISTIASVLGINVIGLIALMCGQELSNLVVILFFLFVTLEFPFVSVRHNTMCYTVTSFFPLLRNVSFFVLLCL